MHAEYWIRTSPHAGGGDDTRLRPFKQAALNMFLTYRVLRANRVSSSLPSSLPPPHHHHSFCPAPLRVHRPTRSQPSPEQSVVNHVGRFSQRQVMKLEAVQELSSAT